MTKLSKPANMTWLSPYLLVHDVEAAIDFYQKAFHFEKGETHPGEDGTVQHGELTYKGQMIMVGKESAHAGAGNAKTPKNSGLDSPMTLYLYCEDVDAFHRHAVAAGAHALSVPEDMFWGDRICQLKDRDGYVWCFATHLNEQ